MRRKTQIMPWTSHKIDQIARKLATLIYQEFKITPSCPAFLCTRKELQQRIHQHEYYQRLQEQERKYFDYTLLYICGKYFSSTQEIWIVDECSNKQEILFHELLHSIQKCSPNREKIVSYLSWKILQDPTAIEEEIQHEWEEIEQQYGLAKIKQRLITEGDCEEF